MRDRPTGTAFSRRARARIRVEFFDSHAHLDPSFLPGGAHVPDVTATAVAIPGVDIHACRRLAEELGVGFRVRRYDEPE
jgi:hypothetical protein